MRAVLFDLDSTLLDTHALYAEAYARAFRDEGVAMPGPAELRRRPPTSELTYLTERYGDGAARRLHGAMLSAYRELAPGHLRRGFFAGIVEVLDAIERAALRTGIVTGKSRAAFEVTCSHVTALRERFEVVVVEDDVPRPKPDPSGIRRALQALDVAPHDTVYVGDHPADGTAAQRAGAVGARSFWHRPAGERPALASSVGAGLWALLEPSDLLGRLGLSALG